jgi:hypothetical protein
MSLEIRVKDSQKKVHQQHKTQNKVDYEIKTVTSVDLIGWQHDVGIVGSRHQDEHVETCVSERAEVLNTLLGA